MTRLILKRNPQSLANIGHHIAGKDDVHLSDL